VFPLDLIFENFVSQQISVGRFGSTSEVIRAGLRLLEERETRFAALRQAITEGIDSGMVEFSLEEINRELDDESRT
jgi:antitoxin ParD1/3/4